MQNTDFCDMSTLQHALHST